MNQRRPPQSTALSARERQNEKEHLQCFRVDAPLSAVISCIEQQHKTLIMMRGVPGSGKSHLARHIKSRCSHGQIFSTDDFFYTSDGIYQFDPSKLPDYHAQNLNNVTNAVEQHMKTIIVDNTNIFGVHMQPYVCLAVRYGYEVYFIEPDTVWKFDVHECARRTSHSVPVNNIQKMLADYVYERRINLADLIHPIRVRITARRNPASGTTSVPAFSSLASRPPSSGHSGKSPNQTEQLEEKLSDMRVGEDDSWTTVPTRKCGTKPPASTPAVGSKIASNRR